MAEKKNSSQKSTASGASQSTKKGYPSQGRISGLIEQLHSKKGFYLLGGFCQILLELTVVFISVIGLIQPFWLSAGLSVLGSVAVTTGIYLCYSFFNNLQKDTLLRDAMRRIVEDQN